MTCNEEPETGATDVQVACSRCTFSIGICDIAMLNSCKSGPNKVKWVCYWSIKTMAYSMCLALSWSQNYWHCKQDLQYVQLTLLNDGLSLFCFYLQLISIVKNLLVMA